MSLKATANQSVQSGTGNKGQLRFRSGTNEVIVDLEAETVAVNGQGVHLRGVEKRILMFLALHAGVMQSEEAILGAAYDPQNSKRHRPAKVSIHYLRRELGPSGHQIIRSERGRGYCIIPSHKDKKGKRS